MQRSSGRTHFVGSFTTALPEPSLPEVAFAGRSNVGKSSAINLLLGVAGIARVAKTPGRTQALNFFSVEDRWIAVDLPGYGYARVSKTLQESWKGYIETYLGERSALRLVVVLVDARHPPKDMDVQLLDALRGAVLPTLVIATKIDALPRSQRASALAGLASAHGRVIGFSATERIGKDEVIAAIEAAISTPSREPAR